MYHYAKLLLCLLFFFYSEMFFGQQTVYDSLVTRANMAFQQKWFSDAGMIYLNAFKALGYRGFPEDRYQAARALTAAGMPDSALYQLTRLYEKTDYLDYDTLWAEPLFKPLHTAGKWQEISAGLKPDLPELADELKRIQKLDQADRQKLKPFSETFGHQSDEYKNLRKAIHFKDSINQIRVFEILDQYGWLGRKQVGARGNKTLFLVVQHAGLEAQEKYLPLMRQAVAAGNAERTDLALLEDRILLRQGKKQRYGTQRQSDHGTGQTIYPPIEDIDNLNKRREEVGLFPFSKATIEEIKQQQKN